MKSNRSLTFVTYLTLISFALPAHAEKIDDQNQPVYVESTEPHKVQLLDTAALYYLRMLEAIESADESLDLEYFSVYFCDVSTRYLFSAIQKRVAEKKAAGKELKVRLLFDHFEFQEVSKSALTAWTKIFKQHGIDAKIYNFATGLIDKNHRTHQKRLIVDGKRIVTGGRLPGDPYLGYNSDFNRLDQDLWIEGPLVKTISNHFDYLFNHKISTNQFYKPTDRANVRAVSTSDRENIHWLKNCLEPTEMPQEVREKLKQTTALHSQQSPEITVNRIGVGLDYPGRWTKSKSFIPMLHDELRAAQSSVLMENQYFIPSKEIEKTLQTLVDKRTVSVEILTNSYSSGDNPEVEWFTLQQAKKFVEKHPTLKISLFRGRLPDGHRGVWREETAGAKWQVHSKVAVIDGKTSWVGTNNLDSRSDEINLETGILIRDNPKFAEILTRSIRDNLALGVQVTPNNPLLDCITENPDTLDEFVKQDRLSRSLLLWFY